MLGTTDYVSPEQALGQPVTGQSDLYSLGVVLFEMLTGDVPFHGSSPVAVAMKHVREDVPDVQLLRPELSAATAAVVERAVSKDLARRYRDAASMVADLEEVLAIEAARAGQATGEVTSVLRTLPGTARRRLPWRMRHPARWVASLALIVVDRRARARRWPPAGRTAAPGCRRASPPTPVSKPVQLSQTAAHDYNPFGTGPENRDQVENVIDSDPNTVVEHRAVLRRHAPEERRRRPRDLPRRRAPACSPRRSRSRRPRQASPCRSTSPTTIDLELPYGNSTPLARRGWQGPVGASADVQHGERIPLALSGRPYRYYLVWLTTLPPGSESATIAELTLFK